MTICNLFLWHPGLRDFRVKFFNLLSKKYTVHYLFLAPSTISSSSRIVIPQEFQCDYCSERGPIGNRLLFRWIPFQDTRKMYTGIKHSDLFVSEFVWNAYTIVGLAICKLLRKKSIVWEEINVIRPGFISSVRHAVIRLLCENIDAFFVMGRVPENGLKRLGISSDKIFVANEYPAHVFSEVKCKEVQRMRIDRNDHAAVYVGRLVEFKGVEYLIKAFRLVEQEVDRARLLIAGVGPLRTRLEALVTAIGLENCKFLGNVSEDEKAYLLGRCDVVVVPSIITRKENEGGNGPAVILEALSAGRPVITTTAAGSNADFIRNGINGFVVPERDVNALAEKIKHLLRKPIPSSHVLADFRQIKGVDYQLEQFEKAVNYAMRTK